MESAGLNSFYTGLARLLRHDPGGRGLAQTARAPDLGALCRRLMDSGRLIILTGFPILAAGIGETDGPPGAANMARALTDLGKAVCLVSDRLSIGLVEAARDARAPQAETALVGMEDARGDCRRLLEAWQPDCIIAIERPGKHGGHYHNARGMVIDHLVADTDLLLERRDAATVAIGDGGNEVGMGGLRQAVADTVPGGADIVADLGCDFPLVAGVSNWWGWGVAALLSVAAGRDLLPSDEQETALLEAVVAAGGVDGMAGRPQMTVDGLSLAENLGVLRRIRALTRAALQEQA